MKTKYKISLLIGVAIAVLIPLGYWLSGFDFNERGTKLCECYVMTLLLAAVGAALTAAYPD